MKLSDKFSESRNYVHAVGYSHKQTVTFNKFIRKIRRDIKENPEYDIASTFDFYAVNCEECQKNNKEIVEMYLVGSKELNLIIAKENELEADRPDLILRCPKCFNEKRVIDMRKHITIKGIEPIDENEGTDRLFHADFGRDKDNPLNSFEENVRIGLEQLMAMPTKNKQAKKELEKYIKEYAAVVKKVAKPLSMDYQALLSNGKTLTEVENIKL